MRDSRQVVLRPLVTEKATALKDDRNQVSFQVALDANKVDIRRAVETIFKVKVVGVRTQVVFGKEKRMGRFVGRRPSWKKAVVQLAPDTRSAFRVVEQEPWQSGRLPTSAGRRFQTVLSFDEITATRPKGLVVTKKRSGGRNSLGRITTRHIGGGHKQKIRLIDFRREKFGVPARVAAIEYDPNRSARIALLHYRDGEKRYILAPHGLKVDDTVVSGPAADILPGNALPLRAIPAGTTIHNVELQPGKGGQLCRSAGTGAQLVAKEGQMAHVKLPSGEIRLIHQTCLATIGGGNLDHGNVSVGKAGAAVARDPPTVCGTAMNPVDHPMGGASTGGQPPRPVGQTDQGRQDAAASAVGSVHRCPPRATAIGGDGTLGQQGPLLASSHQKVEALGTSRQKVIKTWSRRSTISPDFVGHTLAPQWQKFIQSTRSGSHWLGGSRRRGRSARTGRTLRVGSAEVGRRIHAHRAVAHFIRLRPASAPGRDPSAARSSRRR
jgi:large subunit ribosomal protein L2